MHNVLTIYAQAKDSDWHVGENVYATRYNKLYIRLFDEDADTLLVCEPVTTCKQADSLLAGYPIHHVDVATNTDVSNRIDVLSSRLGRRYFNRLTPTT
jgi:hypothetical protein